MGPYARFEAPAASRELLRDPGGLEIDTRFAWLDSSAQLGPGNMRRGKASHSARAPLRSTLERHARLSWHSPERAFQMQLDRSSISLAQSLWSSAPSLSSADSCGLNTGRSEVVQPRRLRQHERPECRRLSWRSRSAPAAARPQPDQRDLAADQPALLIIAATQLAAAPAAALPLVSTRPSCSAGSSGSSGSRRVNARGAPEARLPAAAPPGLHSLHL